MSELLEDFHFRFCFLLISVYNLSHFFHVKSKIYEEKLVIIILEMAIKERTSGTTVTLMGASLGIYRPPSR